MSTAGLSRAHTIDSDIYDHAIGLVDSTAADAETNAAVEEPQSPGLDGAPLGRQSTRQRLKEELTRRKYAKYQEGKQSESTAQERSNAKDVPEGAENPGPGHGKRSELAGRLRDNIVSKHNRKVLPAKEKPDYEVDILYENQRGSFLCGIPLYSANSLLNFDPSGWQTSNLNDSPVNITNAQVPDPSWAWAWRTWYVDMSHDVDEEGWEYSFSFGEGFAWHGSHPWFHSFVRRRRWLRKRIKIRPLHAGKKDDMKAAHLLTAEYFTIHPKREPSPDSIAVRTIGDRSTYFNSFAKGDESDEEPSEIADLIALMAALRRSRVDREKVVAMKNFLDHGGDEIYYLADRMDDIMRLFIYQTSRRQLQTLLLEALDEATEKVEGPSDGEKEGEKPGQRRADNLLKAVQAAKVHINDEDYWSEVRTKANSEKPPQAPTERETLDPSELSGGPGQGPTIDEEARVGNIIKGIPEEAHVSEAPGINWKRTSGSPLKGKGKE